MVTARWKLAPPPDNDSAVPPVVCCAVCGSVACPGCAMLTHADVAHPVLPWEAAGSLRRRIWVTALNCSEQPAQAFGCLAAGRVAPAIRFALVAESLAIGSFLVAGILSLM